MPEISVIVPIYKAEAFLRKCADSVLNQTFSDLEAEHRQQGGGQA